LFRIGEQVDMMLAYKGFHGRSLLALATVRGDKDTFEAVLTVENVIFDLIHK